MYTGQTMKLDTYKLGLEEVIFNFAYDNTKKTKNEINKILEDGSNRPEKDEDTEKLKANNRKGLSYVHRANDEIRHI